jgi:tRNA1Val (adenine37-N6)-methyltransferase
MIEQARQYFPRGLAQPQNGFRFSMDALLLACFVPSTYKGRILDLGTGCGVIGLTLLLRRLQVQVIGLDRDFQTLVLAQNNIRRLGLEDRFSLFSGDVCQFVSQGPVLRPGSLSGVVCNPPYRHPQSGRTPKGQGRLEARFSSQAQTEAFVQVAANVLKVRGRLYLVYWAQRLNGLFGLLNDHRLEPKRVCFVHGRAGYSAKLALVEACKGGGQQLIVEPPLVLHDQDGLTDQALSFCPFLGCNA